MIKLKNIFFGVVVISSLLLPTIVFADTDLTIMSIDTDNWGDSNLLKSDDDYLLMDVTTGTTTEIIDFMLDKKVQKFDLYLSHYHNDHYGGGNKLTVTEGEEISLMEYFIRNENKGLYKNYIYDIGTVYLPDPTVCEKSTETKCEVIYKKLVDAAQEMGINVVILTTGSKFTFGNTSAEVLYINTDETIMNDESVDSLSSFLNNTSLVTVFTNGKTKFLTAGDIQSYTENKLLELGIDVSADIFKLSHHAFQYDNTLSNTPAFIEKVNPKYVFFQFDEGAYTKIQTTLKLVRDTANLYNPQRNGTVNIVVKNDEITPVITENMNKIKINYISKDENKVLYSKTYNFSNKLYGITMKYHLFDYNRAFEGYTLCEDLDEIIPTGILTKDITYNLYYTKNTNAENTPSKDSSISTNEKNNTSLKNSETDANDTQKNPKTGIKVNCFAIIFFVLIGIVSYLIIRKQSKFPKYN